MRWDNDVRVKEAASALIEAPILITADERRRRRKRMDRTCALDPMAFVAEWAVDGGRNGALAAFNAEKLKTPEYVRCLRRGRSRRDDDKPMLALAKTLASAGHEVLLVTKDMFRDHIRDGPTLRRSGFELRERRLAWSLNSERLHQSAARGRENAAFAGWWG